MKVAYVGSCYSEEFLKHVLGNVQPNVRFYRVNSVSLMDQKQVDLGDMSSLTPATQRHLSYENRKNFRERMRKTSPDLLVVDFIRDGRCALLTDGEAYLSFPYELIGEAVDSKAPFLEHLDIVPFGSPEYVRLHRQALDRFTTFLNKELPDTRVLFLNFRPAWDYRGRTRSKRDYLLDYMAWSARGPMLDMMNRYCAARTDAGILLDYDGPIWSDDLAKYGPAPVHYAAACWRLMASRFDADTLSFVPREPDGVAELASRLRTSFEAFGDEVDEVSTHWRSLERSGADIFADILPALLHEAQYRIGMNRRPSVVDAYQAFFWLLGRTPENTLTLLSHASEPTLQHLRLRLFQSGEFQYSMARLLREASPPPATVVTPVPENVRTDG